MCTCIYMYVLSFQGGEIDAAVPASRPIILHIYLPVLLAEKVYPLVHIIISTRDWLIDSGSTLFYRVMEETEKIHAAPLTRLHQMTRQ